MPEALKPDFDVRLARSEAELRAAQRLRYEVFVTELGADGEMVDHDARLEVDAFDAHSDHMLVFDHTRGRDPIQSVVGVYRLLPGARRAAVGQFYSEGEYDLDPLLNSGRSLLELGRSCVHRDYRGGAVMFHLWSALAAYTLERDVDVLFGTASFAGTDIQTLAAPLSLLHHRHLAPADMRVRCLPAHFQSMDLIPLDALNVPAAMKQVPALIKAYLRLGGTIGDGAFVDHAFNTTDVFLILDVANMNERQRAIYTRGLT